MNINSHLGNNGRQIISNVFLEFIIERVIYNTNALEFGLNIFSTTEFCIIVLVSRMLPLVI